MTHQEYWNLWTSTVVDHSHFDEIFNAANTILTNWSRYKAVGDQFSIPPYVVGVIHYREASFDFNTYLANGDPLFDKQGNAIKTVHVPQGLGPFKTWEDAAIASIQNMGWGQGWHWDIVNALENLRSYNGTGYELYHKMNTPYLWSFTNHYTKGKYSDDGKWDADLIDHQSGCVPILLALKGMGIDLNEVAPQA